MSRGGRLFILCPLELLNFVLIYKKDNENYRGTSVTILRYLKSLGKGKITR